MEAVHGLTSSRSNLADPVADELYDLWLVPNGVDGWLTVDARFVVGDGTFTYPRWRRRDDVPGDGWAKERVLYRDDIDPGLYGTDEGMQPAVEEVTLPLLTPVTDRVRQLFARTTLTLVETA